MCYKKLTMGIAFSAVLTASAQFHTITKEKEIPYYTQGKEIEQSVSQTDTITIETAAPDSTEKFDKKGDDKDTDKTSSGCYTYTSPETRYEYARARGRKPRSVSDDTKKEKRGRANTRINSDALKNLPELTIPNLYAEIKKNGIKYPKIVLAQAILETGWFKSSVCRNKNNLFGLTNPRTKTYYEFDHWTESVAAYYSKVQYRYKGGNYLLWLRDIGYAEDKGYIQAIIRVLKQI